MAGTDRELARVILDRYGRTFGEELGIDVAQNTPQQLFQLLVYALLASARIGHRIAMDAARALFDEGWTTAERLDRSTWSERTRVLNRAGYARYDESTSRMLGDAAEMLLERYRGDLRKLREAAGHDPARERVLLEECKGIGQVGADIFFREVQVAWDEIYPFADRVSLRAARRLGLPDEPRALAKLVKREQLAHLVAGLVRVDLDKAWDELKAPV